MHLKPEQIYHLYNRSNNTELLFKNEENYRYFLRKFKKRLENFLTVYAYCLMPTHFHFLIKVDAKEIDKLRKNIGIQLSSYTKAINKAFGRNGSLFQQHTKAKIVDDETYLLRLVTYIHQNPLRSGLVENLTTWKYSSYLDLAGYRNGTLVDHSVVNEYFASVEDFRAFSNQLIHKV